MKAVSITEEGIEAVEKMLGIKDIYTEKGIKYVHHLEQALRAQAVILPANRFLRKDKDYVVKNGEIIIVDEFTGRLMPGRRWSEGLHQAIEAKEGVPVQKESRTLASITFQNYFRMYKKLARNDRHRFHFGRRISESLQSGSGSYSHEQTDDKKRFVRIWFFKPRKENSRLLSEK